MSDKVVTLVPKTAKNYRQASREELRNAVNRGSTLDGSAVVVTLDNAPESEGWCLTPVEARLMARRIINLADQAEQLTLQRAAERGR